MHYWGQSMAIEAIVMEGPEARVPDNVVRLIATCSRGWERFFADHDAHQAPRFVPSVPERVFAVLEEVTTRQLPPTRIFCEWGSGFGTATCLAALLGYEAYGLEIEEELVRRSRAIARRLGIPVEILCTSFLPEGYEASVGVDGTSLGDARVGERPPRHRRGQGATALRRHGGRHRRHWRVFCLSVAGRAGTDAAVV